MDPESPDPRRRKRLELLEMYDAAIAELRSLNDPAVADLIDRLEHHRAALAQRTRRNAALSPGYR